MLFSNFTLITQRVSLSIAIIAMVNGTQRPAPPNGSAGEPPADAPQRPGPTTQQLQAGVRSLPAEAPALCGGRNPTSLHTHIVDRLPVHLDPTPVGAPQVPEPLRPLGLFPSAPSMLLFLFTHIIVVIQQAVRGLCPSGDLPRCPFSKSPCY